MKNYYDIAIIGGGIGGLMAAYRITERDHLPRFASSRKDTRLKNAAARSSPKR